MEPLRMTPTVAIADLKLGMFIHLDLGWMSHPFPLSSFRLTSAEQIATLRTLGLSHVRWSPEKSVLIDTEAEGRAAREAAEAAARAAGPSAEQLAAIARRQALGAQRQAEKLAERQYAEAAKAWRDAAERVATQPVSSREDTEALTRALLDKLLVDGDLCIRLLAGGAADRSTAHALNVTVIALLMARAVGLSEAELTDLGTGALLHDVGKLDLPARVRHLDEGFTTAEANAYRQHVAAGVAHGKRMGLSPGALAVLAQHHEHADGTGFPLKLVADRCTMASRIVSIVNRYDNLCNPLQPARALTPHEAVSMLFAQYRQRFDATLLNAFIRMMGVYPAGSCVQLTDERWALVVGVNSSRPLKPRVLLHDPKVPRDEALHLNLEDTPDLGIRRSVPISKLPEGALAYLAPRPRVAYFFEPAVPVDAVARASEAVA
jgi:putative nucleotidyltransferase with HDIG domain